MPLPPGALKAYQEIWSFLCSKPDVDYPWKNLHYSLITDASLGDDNKPGAMGAILTQTNNPGDHSILTYASQKLQAHKTNYTPFFLEMHAAIWGMDHFSA